MLDRRAEVRRELILRGCRADLFAFARHMFHARKGFYWQEARHHRLICDALMRVYSGECRRLIINIPPRYSKTELAVVNFVAWCFGRVPDCEFIHASYSGALAVNNSRAIRELMCHESYAELFPDSLLASDAAHHWTTTDGGVMYATGAGGTITGFGAGKHRAGFSGAILLDDPHKADEARSDVMRRNVIDWFQNTLESRKNSPETPVILVMQRLHEHDLSGWLLDGGNGEDWDRLILPVWNDDGSPLWPDKHDADALRRMEQASPYVFAGQYRQRPAPPAGGVIKPDQLQIVDAPPAGVRWVRGWDFASTTTGDYTAGGLVGALPDGRYVIGDMVRLRAGPDERDAALKNTAIRDGKSTRISIPQDPGQAGKTQALYLTRGLAGFPVTSSPESGDKVTRAEPMAAQINIGNVLMVRGAWNNALIEEMRMFPNGAFDDQVDSLSRAFCEVMGSAQAGHVAVAGKRPDFGGVAQNAGGWR